jgi:FlaA1/EpsC-like NDP-sugar epimerase
MIQESLKFLCPTKLFRELNILVLIEENPRMSQHTLAKKMGVTSTMVNFYMNDSIRKKMVCVEGETNRQKQYFLTFKGKRRKRQLLNEYITGVSDLYSTCKKEFEQRLRAFYRKGLRRVVFFGAAETCEIACQAVRHTEMEVVGIVDNDFNKHHKKMGGVEILPPEYIEELHPDAVIITALGHPDEIYRQLYPLKEKGILIKKF